MHTHSKRRLTSAFAIAAVGIGVALSSTGCGAGQVSQSANQAAAVNGAAMNFGALALRDVQILYPEKKAGEVFGNGGPFTIVFVISNNSPDNYYRLDKITAPKGDVTIVNPIGDRIVAPNGVLRAGSPVGLLTDEAKTATGTKDTNTPKRLVVTLDNAGKTVAAGLTTKLHFTFSVASVVHKDDFGPFKAEVAGVLTDTVTVDTPVDAGPYLERQDVPREAEAPEDTH
ncbi:hypothetical protein HH308_21815 [Gordonia sp. TBRC 11910]|uniref:Lipoprotein n=1 Tax=Gordonia asplenii TaxID=2725283 RepID=A0A848KYP3_9ACTN|nr:hypothetical protein [Gordonia asplenii]